MRLCAVLILAATPALADAPPTVKPTRDVDVTYKVPVGAGATALLQRLRFSAALHKQRVDLPTSGNWMVLDFGTGRMAMVRDQSHEIVELPAPDTAALPDGGASFVRGGASVVDGLPCTEWHTRDIRGRETTACYTADGVMLRALSDSGAVLMEAVSVKYATLDPGVFALPEGYSVEKRE